MKYLTILIILSLLVMPVSAQVTIPKAGITPDSPFYAIDVFLDDMKLMFAFSEEAKTKVRLQIADERLAEVQAMINANNVKGIQEALIQHERIMSQIHIQTNGENTTERLQYNLELQNQLRIHEQKIEMVRNSIQNQTQYENQFDTLIDHTQALNGTIEINKEQLRMDMDNYEDVSKEIQKNLPTHQSRK